MFFPLKMPSNEFSNLKICFPSKLLDLRLTTLIQVFCCYYFLSKQGPYSSENVEDFHSRMISSLQLDLGSFDLLKTEMKRISSNHALNYFSCESLYHRSDILFRICSTIFLQKFIIFAVRSLGKFTFSFFRIIEM